MAQASVIVQELEKAVETGRRRSSLGSTANARGRTPAARARGRHGSPAFLRSADGARYLRGRELSPRPPDSQGFMWGVATSAFQVEGAVDEDGRGPSIWDTFCRHRRRCAAGIRQMSRATSTTYARTLCLWDELGVGAYRFSIAWPGCSPDGRGPGNPRGLDHYRRLVEELNGRGIAAVVTLYHWDLPQALEDGVGGRTRDTAERFAEYAAIVHRALSGGVGAWITVNEPWVAAWLGYRAGCTRPVAPMTASRSPPAITCCSLMPWPGTRSANRSDHAEPGAPSSGLGGSAERGDRSPGGPTHDALFLDPLFGRGYPRRSWNATGLCSTAGS